MLLLLVSCASGAVLLLSRAIARRQEIAVRISLGAAGRRVLRQLLSENLLLAAVAGALGLYLALQIPKAFQKLAPAMPHYSFTLDWHVFDYLAAITLPAAIAEGEGTFSVRRTCALEAAGSVGDRTGFLQRGADGHISNVFPGRGLHLPRGAGF